MPSKHYGVWFHGRNTPKVVRASGRAEAIRKARASGTAGSGRKVKAARALKGKSLTDARAGRWVRESASGKSTSLPSQQRSAFRPHANKSKK